MPQPKKDPSIRARANVASTAKTLERATGYEVPELPDFPEVALRGDDGDIFMAPGYWHKQTSVWWEAIFTSPLPGAWEDFDVPTLFTLALLYNDIWIAPTAKDRKSAAAEFRLQRKDFFIAPYDRLRGEIVFAEAGEARERTARIRQRQASAQPIAGNDPRTALGT